MSSTESSRADRNGWGRAGRSPGLCRCRTAISSFRGKNGRGPEMERAGGWRMVPREIFGGTIRRGVGAADVGERAHQTVTCLRCEQAWAIIVGLIIGSALAFAIAEIVAQATASDCLGSIAGRFG